MEAGKIRFMRLCGEELSRERPRDGIGLLAEKRLHAVLKRWVEEDVTCHEVKVTGEGKKSRKFVADVQTKEGHIFEIQTGKLYPLRQKLAFYMEETAYPVTVLHPLFASKYISWLDKASGEVKARKRSPHHESVLHGIAELKPFIAYLGSPRFTVCFVLIEADEYRLLDGWGRGGKRGSHRYELLPLGLLDTCYLARREDYAATFPDDPRLAGEFTAKEFGKVSRLRGYALYDALAVFEALGVIEKCGKEKRAALYQKI